MKNLKLEEIYRIPIHQVAHKLGFEVNGNSTNCFNKTNHKNNDKNPSLQLMPKSNTWKCHVCQFEFGPDGNKTYGNNIDLVRLSKGLSFEEVLEWFKESFPLPAKIGEVKNLTQLNLNGKEDRLKNEVYKELLHISDAISNKGFEYLKSRGLTKEIIYGANIFDIKADTLKKLLATYGRIPLSKVGLISKNGKFIFQVGSIVFPFYYFDEIFFLQSRSNSKPKYINASIEIDFPYNINNLLFDDIKNDKCLIVEGVIDTLSLAQNGYNVVGTIGAMNFKEKWISYFKIREVTPILAFDSDTAGESGSNKLAELFLKNGLHPEIINPKEFGNFKDWNEIIINGIKL